MVPKISQKHLGFSCKGHGMVRLKTILAFLSVAAMILGHFEGAGAEMTERKVPLYAGTDVNLPGKIGVWSKSEAVRRIDSTNIFQYMNGAGELYLAYGFDHIGVYEYTADQKSTIQVEVYFMKSSDDAFGLLSLDWSGDPVNSGLPGETEIAPKATALYGMGLLRLRLENVYVRILSMRETPEIRDAILALGEAMQTGRKPAPEPELLKALPPTVGPDWRLRKDRIGWFRSHLVLNSLYYISHQNILDLDHSAEAVTAPYESEASDPKRVQFMLVKYASEKQCEKALARFHSAYLPEYPASGETGFYALEAGWLGYRKVKNRLGLVFDCPDEKTARGFMTEISFHP